MSVHNQEPLAENPFFIVTLEWLLTLHDHHYLP